MKNIVKMTEITKEEREKLDNILRAQFRKIDEEIRLEKERLRLRNEKLKEEKEQLKRDKELLLAQEEEFKRLNKRKKDFITIVEPEPEKKEIPLDEDGNIDYSKLSADEIDFNLIPITADLVKNHPQKAFILMNYYNWLDRARKQDKKEMFRLQNRINSFKYRKRKREKQNVIHHETKGETKGKI